MIEKKLSNATPLDDENVVLRRSDKKELANVSLSNLNEVGEKHFLNKTQITNCILEAPNGVATYSGHTVTVKQGLKVLMPNGRNTDGTLNNIEYTVPSDSAISVSTTTTSNSFLIVNNPINEEEKNVYGWWEKAVFIQEDEPTNLTNVLRYSSVIWYQPSKNIWWYLEKNATIPYDWVDSGSLCIVGYYDRGGTTTIQSITLYQPVELLKQSDKSIIGSWGMPSNKYIELTFGASGSTYTAPANGYLRAYITSTGSASLWTYLNVINSSNDLVSRSGNWHATTASYYTLTAFLPMLKGQTARITYTTAANITEKILTFVYVEGEM